MAEIYTRFTARRGAARVDILLDQGHTHVQSESLVHQSKGAAAYPGCSGSSLAEPRHPSVETVPKWTVEFWEESGEIKEPHTHRQKTFRPPSITPQVFLVQIAHPRLFLTPRFHLLSFTLFFTLLFSSPSRP